MKDDTQTPPHLEAYRAAVAASGSDYVIGADECGFGSWAGPLYVCAAAVPVGWSFKGIDDSKKLKTAAKREEMFYWLRSNPKLKFEIATADVEEIDRDGLGKALKRCYLEVLAKFRLMYPAAHVVVDGEVQLEGVRYQHFPRADGHIQAVSAASIYGKVLHDRQMVQLASKYPGYGFGDHMGYGSAAHEDALRMKGMSPIHRKYTPMERIMTGKRGNKIVDFDDDVEIG